MEAKRAPKSPKRAQAKHALEVRASGTADPKPRLLVVGCGAIGGVVAAHLLSSGQSVTALSTNPSIGEALRQHGFRVKSEALTGPVLAGPVVKHAAEIEGPFDYILLAVQPPQLEAAVESVAPKLAEAGRLVCFQNGLCEEIAARRVGKERVVGAVVAWGASMGSPGVYERTSSGGFSLGNLSNPPDQQLRLLAELLGVIGPVQLTTNLAGVRWSKLGINCAVSTLGTVSGGTLGTALRQRSARRLALEIISEVVEVARAEGVALEKVSGTLDLAWLRLTPKEARTSASVSLFAKHALILGVGARYRRLRSSMLGAIERGRPPAIDFLNGEVVERAGRHGISVPANQKAREFVWQIARGERRASLEALAALYQATR